MIKDTISRKETTFFSKVANDFIYAPEIFEDFVHRIPSNEAITKQLKEKQKEFSQNQRSFLVETLEKQYESVESSEKTQKQITALNDSSTFTVTTGHQLSIFTGPLFFIYKILHIIKWCDQLNEKFSDYHFVPVYWMASEDHDFEEINHFNVFGQYFEWESEQKGAVGRFQLNDFQAFKQSVKERFSNDSEICDLVEKHYKENDSLSLATFKLVHELFEKRGLLVIEPDNKALKTSFKSILKKEIESEFSAKAVRTKSEKLDELGYKTQVNPRAINLFYLSEGKRERIIKEGNTFHIGENNFSFDDLIDKIEKHPENFSPNVVLRPVYQEFILPNLAYVGGSGEIAYWLQLKDVFETLALTFPLLQIRNSIQLFDGTTQKKINKLELEVKDTFKPLEKVKKQIVLDHSEEDLDFSGLEELSIQLSAQIKDLIGSVDEGLKGYGESESVKLNKQIEGMKAKLIRHQKKKFETTLQQLENVYDRLFPEGRLQERHDNGLVYFAKHGILSFIDEIYTLIDPNEKDLILGIEE